ncbi:MAG: glycosyltransferase [Bacteroidales bacterium]|nr:glycosyltransferase [Bacteroidales bacterium]
MSITRVAVVYDDRPRPETTGGYCLRALSRLVECVAIRPDQVPTIATSAFDLVVRIDDGLSEVVTIRDRPLVWWAIDTHLDLDRCVEQAQQARLTFTAQRPGVESLQKRGIMAEWLPLACEPSIHRAYPVPKRYDVGFVGHLFPGPRAELLTILQQRFPDHFVGQRYFDDMARTYSACRVVFNRSIADDLNMRVFEALACGSLLATNVLPAWSGQDRLFRAHEHLLVYQDAADLLDQVAYYLAHPEARSRIEEAGQRAVLARHTYQHRMKRILAVAETLPTSVAVAASTPETLDTEPEGTRSRSLEPGYFEFERPELLARIPVTASDVVDVGCGSGRLGAALKARQSVRVVGVEHNRDAAAAARTRLDLVIEADAETLDWPFPPASFDAVICGDILEHLREPLKFLRRIRTWLRPDGVLITSLPNVRHHSVVRGLLSGDWTYESAGLLDQTHLRFFTRREVEKLLYRAGFMVPRLDPVPGPGYADWAQAGRPGEVVVAGLRIGPMKPSEAEEFFTYQWLAIASPDCEPPPGLTSIVILAHNELPYTRRCLESIRLVTDEPYELVLVDNGSSDGTADYFRQLASWDPHLQVVLNPVNRGFPIGVNQGLTLARGEQVLLLNNDTVVTTGWLRRMLRVLQTQPRVGLVGPCSNRVSGPQQIPVPYGDDLVGLDGFAWTHGQTQSDQVEITDRLVGFCLLVRQTVIASIGLLDEEFGLGNFEDDDYVYRAREAGFQAAIARAAFVHHVGGQTFRGTRIDYAALMQTNEARFRAKWQKGSSNRNGTDHRDSGEPNSPARFRWDPDGGLVLEPGEKRPVAVPTRSNLPEIRVSGCLIVRDNAKTIRPCLESLHPWVDELVVVDTGSQDETPAIAAELGARVFHFPWCDDFSAARNESIRYARGSWVFWMDSDDTIDPTNGKRLRDLADQPHPDHVLGYVIRVHCPGPQGVDAGDVTVVDHVKLIRNRPDLRFEHRIHEQILPAIRRAGGDVAWTDLFVVHSGYDHSTAGQARKLDRDLKLLHLDLADRPDHPFTLFNLGMTYADVNRYPEAAGYLEASLRHASSGESHLRKVYALLAHCEARQGRLDTALAVCQRGLTAFPDDLELLFRTGVLYQELGKVQEAITAYQRVLTCQDDRYFASFDRGIAGYKTRHNLALAYEALDNRLLAEDEWRRVIAEMPGFAPGWRGLSLLLLRYHRLDDVDRLLTALTAQPALAVEYQLLAGRAAALRGMLDQARQHWTQAAKLAPQDPEPHRELARLLAETGQQLDAERALRAWVACAPQDPAAHYTLGLALWRWGQFREAESTLRQVITLHPHHPEAISLLEQVLMANSLP